MHENSGGPAGWRALLAEQFRQHGRFFFGVAVGIVRSPAVAEDVCHQALIKAWEQQQPNDDPASLRSWLGRIVLNESLEAEPTPQWRELRALPNVRQLEASPGPMAVQEQAELRDAVLASLDRLPDSVRLIVVLRMMQDVSGNEVAEMLGMSKTEVSRQLHNGMGLLRGMLGEWKGGVA